MCDNNYQLSKYITVDDNTLFVKVKKKIAINFRNLFETAIGLRVISDYFENFLGGGGGGMPPDPLEAR